MKVRGQKLQLHCNENKWCYIHQRLILTDQRDSRLTDLSYTICYSEQEHLLSTARQAGSITLYKQQCVTGRKILG